MNKQEWIRDNASPPILDVGCGYSSYFWLDDGTHIESKKEYLGVDLSKDPNNEGPDLPENFIIADARHIPVGSNSYHTVVLSDILEMVESDPQKVLQEAYRIATDKILVTVPDEENFASLLEPSDFDVPPKRSYHELTLIAEIGNAGIEGNIEVSHTKDFPMAFWLAEVTL